MKQTIYCILAAATLLLTGCGDSNARAKEKDANPSFMFWCFRKEIVSTDYHIPDMTTVQVANYLQVRLKSFHGYESSTYDLDTRTMTIRYKSSIVRKMNFEEGIALFGFAVNARPANAKAKFPQGVK